MWGLLALACATQAPLVWSPDQLTDGGSYRIATSTTTAGLLLRVTLATGAPVEDAALSVDVLPTGTPVLVDPGECDDIGELRCFHPGGVYRLLGAPPDALRVTVDAGLGIDRTDLLQKAPPPPKPR